MSLFKSIKNAMLGLVSIFILSTGLTAESSAREIEEIKKHSSPLLSSSLNVLIYPFQNAPESSDPMNDEIDDIDITIQIKQRNFLFEKVMKFNDSFQRFTQNFTSRSHIKKIHNSEIQDNKTSDKKEINCQVSSKP